MELHISEQLAIHRKRTGKSQQKIADESGVSLAMVRKIEAREVDSRVGDLEKLAAVFGLVLVVSFREL